jgi:uncharacterized protein YkwD
MASATASPAAPARPARRRLRPFVGLIAVLAVLLGAAACMPAEERTFLDRTNALRASQGVRPLAEQDVLTSKAEAWAQHMAATGQLAHSQLTAGLSSLPWTALAENVGVSAPTGDTLLSLHEAFAASPTHRRNLLDARFTHMGVGVARSADGRVWVAEVFAQL